MGVNTTVTTLVLAAATSLAPGVGIESRPMRLPTQAVGFRSNNSNVQAIVPVKATDSMPRILSPVDLEANEIQVEDARAADLEMLEHLMTISVDEVDLSEYYLPDDD